MTARRVLLLALLCFAIAGFLALKVSVEQDAAENGMRALNAYSAQLDELSATLEARRNTLNTIAELQAARQQQLDRQQELINGISATLDQRGRTLDRWQAILEAQR